MKSSENIPATIAIVLRGAVADLEMATTATDDAKRRSALNVILAAADQLDAERAFPVGTTVRIRGNTGIPGVEGRMGTVVARHEDAIAVRVKLLDGREITVDPENCERVDGGEVET